MMPSEYRQQPLYQIEGQRKSSRPTIGVLAGWQLRGQLYGRVSRHSFPDTLLRGIDAAARDYQCNLLVACGISAPTSPTATRPAWPVLAADSAFVPVGPWNTDGLIVVHPLLSETRAHYIQNLKNTGYPIVSVGSAGDGPAIGIDNEGGIREALEHLIAHGHRRIAFIAGQPLDETGDSGERLQAYRKIAREHGLMVDSHLIAYGLHIVEGGQQAMRQILETGRPFSAVLASNDESAFGAIQVLRESGLKVPEEVAVIGFDDQYEAAFHDPPLTTIHCSIFERGYRALERLLEYLAGKRTTEIERVPPRLIVRQSCGCPLHSTIPPVIAPHQEDSHCKEETCAWLAQTMTDALHTATQQPLDNIKEHCFSLANAFLQSLQARDSTRFNQTLQAILDSTGVSEDEIHIWQVAISVLKGSMPALSKRIKGRIDSGYADKLLHQARILVSENVQRQHWRTAARYRWESDQVGLLTSRLLRALDEEQIFAVLGEHLPHLGIQKLGIAFLEAEGEDPVAWSNLRFVPGATRPARFPSREFPPTNLYPTPFRLILLPLEVENETRGFTVFNMENLDLCGTIVWQLAEALRSAQLYREAVEGRRLAEEANRLKSRFLSTVSHELRTPLGLIVNLSEVLLQGEQASALPDPYRQDLERIYASAQQLDGLIRDVLDLARSDVGQLCLMRELLDLREVLQPVIIVGERMARDKGLAWRTEIPQKLPHLWGDRLRLRQVMLNLISNAIKFTDEGEVVVQVHVGPKEVMISIRDTGLGVPPEEQEAIFNEFRQSERTTSRGYGGMGLGLAICKQLVELHGGTIGVHSSGQEGAGSTFYFTLPLAKETGTRPVVAKKPSTPARILILTSQASAGGRQLRDHLLQQGFAVELLEASEPHLCLTRIASAPPGILMIDAYNSPIPPAELLRWLKEKPITRDITVLFYRWTAEKDRVNVLELDYLAKPVSMAELAQALERQGLIRAEAGEKTILIVDDEPETLEMHARLVQTQLPSCQILKARHGVEALQQVHQRKPDLILLDLMMPGLDGFGVLEALQREETTRGIPVVVLTGRGLTQEDVARLSHSVTAILGKGLFSVEEMSAHLRRALSRLQASGGEAQRLARLAMAYIHEHYAEPLSLPEISRALGISVEHLVRCFRREVGTTPMNYLNRYRINQARKLLLSGSQSITTIASAVGFADSNYFSRVFRRETGISPKRYRQTVGQKAEISPEQR
jgi:signal transduction histidine kinase/DNA-binding LacI/PurR family transcriptional regulator/AraC-like DNA-binding protein/response regulator of citrate/malate metabolism